MQLEILSEILKQFLATYPSLNAVDYTRISVLADEKDTITIEIGYDKEGGDLILQNIHSILGGNNFFPIQFLNKQLDIKIDVVAGEPIVAHQTTDPIPAGISTRPDGSAMGGTYGWGLFIDDRLCGISNWHVWCFKGNNTPLGNRIFFNEQNIGSLIHFEPVNSGGINNWDIAFAAFDNHNQFINNYRQTQNSSKPPYPYRIEFAPNTGGRYYKIGNREPIYREGFLRGVGNVKVKHDNIHIRYNEQLIFSKMSDPGDSGAVIVNKNTNEILGLNTASDDKITCANPLNVYGLYYRGMRQVTGSIMAPVYTLIHNKPKANPFLNVVQDTDTAFDLSSKLFIENINDPTVPIPPIPNGLGGVKKEVNCYKLDYIKDKLGIGKISGTFGEWVRVSFNRSSYTGWINTNDASNIWLDQPYIEYGGNIWG